MKNPIKEKRLIKNLTQEELAKLLNITLRHYQNIEAYKSLPNVITGLKLSFILDTDLLSLYSHLL